MDIQSIGGATSSAPQVSDRISSANSAVAASKQAATPVETVVAPTKAAAVPNAQELDKAVQDINKSLQKSSQNLEFSIDANGKNVVVKVIDLQTKEVLRQFPSEEAIAISKSLDRLQGLLINKHA